MKYKLVCPYKASNNSTCTHKGCKINKRGKRYCNFKNPMKCKLYIEWLENKEKSLEGAENE